MELEDSGGIQKEINAQCEILKIYVKEMTWKVPQAPGFFVTSDFAKGKWDPSFSIEIHVKQQVIAENKYEIAMHGTVTAKTKENTTIFTLDLQQAGIFHFINMSQEQIIQTIQTSCPAILYPYLSRSITDASVQAGFPALLMPLPNIEQGKQQNSETVSLQNREFNTTTNHELLN